MLIVAGFTALFAWGFVVLVRGPLTDLERRDYRQRGIREPWWHRLI